MSDQFEIRDTNYDARVRQSFRNQGIMATIGAEIRRVEPGEVEIFLPFTPGNTQQHGFVHGGVVTTIADSACGFAALTLMAPDSAVLTVEFKVNLMAPATGPGLVAAGKVKKSGKTLTVCTADVFAENGEKRTPVATMLATMMAVEDREFKD